MEEDLEDNSFGYDAVRDDVVAEIDAAREEEGEAGPGDGGGEAGGAEEADTAARIAQCSGGCGSTVYPCTPGIRDGMNAVLEGSLPAEGLRPSPPPDSLRCGCGLLYVTDNGELNYVVVRVLWRILQLTASMRTVFGYGCGRVCRWVMVRAGG